jgi:hypothetical protein
METTTMTSTTHYAAHDDTSVYAVGATPEEAIANARREAQEPAAQFASSRITGELAAWIEHYGWDGKNEAFDIVDGWLIRTTGIEDRVETLRDEAAGAGDEARVLLCERALAGDRRAQLECAWALDNAWAMRD